MRVQGGERKRLGGETSITYSVDNRINRESPAYSR